MLPSAFYVTPLAMNLLLECVHALRARAARGLAAGTPWDAVRGIASSAAAARFRREPELTVRYEDGEYFQGVFVGEA